MLKPRFCPLLRTAVVDESGTSGDESGTSGTSARRAMKTLDVQLVLTTRVSKEEGHRDERAYDHCPATAQEADLT